MRFMHTQHRTALRTSPIFIFGSDEIKDAKLPDPVQVLDRAGCIFGAIALIQAGHKKTGKLSAVEAILHFPGNQFFAVLDPAGFAGHGFMGIVAPTTGADVLLPGIGVTQAAIDPARGDQDRGGLVRES